MNILIVKLSAIGDVIHTLPSLTALRRLYPDAHITWVVEEASRDLILHHPHLDQVIVFRRKNWMADFKKGQWASIRRDIRSFLTQLRSRRYDLVIDFHGLFKSAMVVAVSGGKRKLGYDSWQELACLFLNEKIPEDMSKHAVDRYLDFPLYLGAEHGPAEFVLPVSVEAKAGSAVWQEKYSLKKNKYIAINPVALWNTKLWDNTKFAELADIIQQRLKIPVVFTGRDKESLDDITRQMTTTGIHLGGRTSLLELACIYSDALAVISTDSGPMHLAVAVGTPVIALFGPTDPARTGPYGVGHTVIRAGLPCSPCLRKKCSTKECMQAIQPGQVFAEVQKMWQERGREPV
ncbi:MAG: glycosyltransferase family 9 protein [Syntrophaceae bacterium]|jgi:heptosyltransferase I|nr:glycosyltransferase family 9 protein [Syntrophaceae bacterium]HOC60105.1 glycosyltransferase family 9 protein [Smithellaceae bacterium]HQM46142.1 glycosyltransferase family 9 protein [Smithellaceae bacterium]